MSPGCCTGIMELVKMVYEAENREADGKRLAFLLYEMGGAPSSITRLHLEVLDVPLANR